jgi:hypothetical protein
MRLCALVSVLDFGHYSSLRRRFISLLQLFDLPFPALQILPTHHVYLLTFPSLGALVLPILRLMAGETGTPAVAKSTISRLFGSITSGKRLILADGQEVHYSSSRNSILTLVGLCEATTFSRLWTRSPLSLQRLIPPVRFLYRWSKLFHLPKVFRLVCYRTTRGDKDLHESSQFVGTWR